VDVPSKVVEELLKRHTLTDELIELIYRLMVVEDARQKKYDENYQERLVQYVVGYVTAFHFILDRLPALGDGPFSASIHELAHLELRQVYALTFIDSGQYREFDESELPPEVRRYQGDYIEKYAFRPWKDFLKFKVRFALPQTVRFEHTLITAKSGTGKSELLAYLIAQDIKQDASVVVMAPKGVLIPNIANLKDIHPDRLVVIRPQDGLSLNIFDLGTKGNDEQVNNAVGLINYVFSSILDAEPTAKQRGLLNYSIRLMLHVPDATLLTLRELMASDAIPEDYKKYIYKLNPIGQDFLFNQFANKKEYGETKSQLLWRLDTLLENTTIYNIFSQPRTLFNMPEALDAGKVVLIDTSLRHLGSYGSAFFGRFFIALINLASQQRDPTKNLKPAYVYIDEASTYLSEQIEDIMERARESKIGFTLAHQQLAQFRKVSTSLEASVLTNTGTKYVGADSPDDARTLAPYMKCEPAFIVSQKPHHFALRVSGYLARPVSVSAPFPYITTLPQRTQGEMEHVLQQNRARYSAPVVKKPAPVKTQAKRESPDDDLEDLNKI